MNKRYLNLIGLLFFPVFFFGCSSIGSKAASLSVIYAVMALIALMLFVGYCIMPRKKSGWFVLLFVSVLIVNSGYFALSVSRGLDSALVANRISYLGSVFLPMSVLMIILNVTGISYKKRLPVILALVGTFTFVVAASPGYLDIYYKEVFLETVGGITVLNKVYGPWHCIYLYYLFGYFAAMIGVTIYAVAKKKIDSTAHSVILIVAVFVNLGVWLIEQITKINFEILSVSYIITEMFLLGLQNVFQENQKLKELVASQSTAAAAAEATVAHPAEERAEMNEEREKAFLAGVAGLTKTERMIFDLYTMGKSTREIMETLNIKENTLKFHNKNIYSKLEVSSRKQLKEIYGQIKSKNRSSGTL